MQRVLHAAKSGLGSCVLTLVLAISAATAVTIDELPITPGSSIDLSHRDQRDFHQLLVTASDSEVGYKLTLEGVVTQPFSGAPGQKIRFSGTFRMQPPEHLDPFVDGTMLVFTGPRQSSSPPGTPLTCSPGGLPELQGASMVPESVGGPDAPFYVEATYTPGDGTICPFAELKDGDEVLPFQAIYFEGPGDVTRSFSFDLVVDEQLDLGAGFIMPNLGYVVTPEPSSLLLLALGMAGLSGARRRRLPRGRVV